MRDHTKLQKDLESTGGFIPRGLPRVRHTGGSRYPEDPTGFPRIKYGAGVSSPE